jgi:molecular chaperone GrpE
MSKKTRMETEPENVAPDTAAETGESVLEGEIVEEEHTIGEEDIEALRKALEEMENALAAEKEQSERYLKNWQYTQADLENYKKQVLKDRQLLQETMKVNALRSFLDVMDDLERALGNQPKGEDAEKWAGGISLIHRKMLTYLENEGVKPIQVEGEFNPTLHEAISSEPNPEVESGHIIGVVQQGYQIGNRVLRPARVRVSL